MFGAVLLRLGHKQEDLVAIPRRDNAACDGMKALTAPSIGKLATGVFVPDSQICEFDRHGAIVSGSPYRFNSNQPQNHSKYYELLTGA